MKAKTQLPLVGIACWMLLAVVLQCMAVGLDTSFMLPKGKKGEARQLSPCGVFWCENGSNIRRGELVKNAVRCGELSDHVLAACGFGVTAAVLLFFTFCFHAALATEKGTAVIINDKYLWAVVDDLWAPHLVTALINTISWACLAGAYSRELCDRRLKDFYTLNFGFAFLVVVTFGSFVLSYVCWRNRHYHYPSYDKENAAGDYDYNTSPTHHTNPIDEQNFPQR